MSADASAAPDERLRREKFLAFDLATTSTARRAIEVDFGGRVRPVYANANFSVYSGQRCNARCGFCVEELRPASRGAGLDAQRDVLESDARYFAALGRALEVVGPLRPSVSITGGEPSVDPRLPETLRVIRRAAPRVLTVTTNGSGLFDEREGATVLGHVLASGARHLNVSRAHPDDAVNAKLMGFKAAPDAAALREVTRAARSAGARVRLSCVLVNGAVDDVAGVFAYVDFARSVGCDNVIFRRLMQTDSATVARNRIVKFSDARRAELEPIVTRLSTERFAERDVAFVKQVVGYYYYVEIFTIGDVTACFEEADLARLERTKREDPRLVHELVFHPNGRLCSTWQPWDGVLLEP